MKLDPLQNLSNGWAFRIIRFIRKIARFVKQPIQSLQLPDVTNMMRKN